MVLSIIFLEDKHNIVLHLSILYEYQQFFQHRICFSIQSPDYSDPWPTLARSTSFFLIMLFNQSFYISFTILYSIFHSNKLITDLLWSLTKTINVLRCLCRIATKYRIRHDGCQRVHLRLQCDTRKYRYIIDC